MELLDVFNENNEYLGYSVERSKIHEDNLWHHHVSAWIMNYDGKILLQQRALDKKKNPGKWAKTGGHVDSGETCEESIKREVYEEIGLEVKDNEIENIEIFKSTNPNEHYFSYGYIFFTDNKEEDFKLQKEEAIDKEITAAIKAVAMENKLDAVADYSAIYFGGVDITDKVIKKLNLK